MKKIGIVTDSHSSISQEEAKKLGIFVLPMPFYIDGECYYEKARRCFEAQNASCPLLLHRQTGRKDCAA